MGRARQATGGLSLAAAIAMGIAASIGAEGGPVDNPNDRGGATGAGGVTEKVARANGYQGAMKDFTVAQAAKIYEPQYVYGPHFDLVYRTSIAVGLEITDTGINFGPHRPSCYLQNALNMLNDRGRLYPDVKVDCSIGPATKQAFDALAIARGNTQACEAVLKLMDAQQGAEYLRITKANPSQEAFGFGWTKRLENVPLAQCQLGGAVG